MQVKLPGLAFPGRCTGLLCSTKTAKCCATALFGMMGALLENVLKSPKKIGAERLIEITANPAPTGFTAGKILWVRRHEPEIYARCKKVLLPKGYLRFKLTGEYAVPPR